MSDGALRAACRAMRDQIMPDVTIAAWVEQPEPNAPYGAKGIGEPPTISSSATVAAAVRAATGLALPRIPIRPADIALG